MSSPFVRVLGVALTLGACHPAAVPEPPGNPPVPETTHNPPMPPPPEPTQNPPAPLPTWDEVLSGHPPGATNPPYPILVVSQTPQACFKVWHGGMIPPPADVREAHGRVVATPAEAGDRATQVQCPEGEPQRLLEAYAKLPADTEKAPL
jgi:hypothetical protein